MDWRRLSIFALAGVLCLGAVSCGKKETEQTQEQSQQIKDEIKPASKQAYEECQDAIDYFCSMMEVKKQQLNLIFNFRTHNGAYSYDIGVDGKQDLTGTYIFFKDWDKTTENSKEETWSIARKVTEAEKKERNLEKELGYQCNKNLYEELSFEEPEADPEAVKLLIDESTAKKYDEKRLGTGDIWECWSGFIDQTDHFAVSYYGDTSGWKTGQFDGKKWKMEQHAVFGDGEYYHYDAGAGLLWYFDGKRLMAGDENGKTLYDFTMSEWYKKNHLEKNPTDKYNIVPLTREKAIFNCNLESKEKQASYVVDLKTMKIERSFDVAMYGSYYDGIFYNFDNDKNILEMIDVRRERQRKSWIIRRFQRGYRRASIIGVTMRKCRNWIIWNTGKGMNRSGIVSMRIPAKSIFPILMGYFIITKRQKHWKKLLIQRIRSFFRICMESSKSVRMGRFICSDFWAAVTTKGRLISYI